MNWDLYSSFFEELQKIGEAQPPPKKESLSYLKKKQDQLDALIENGVPIIGGAGVGKTLSGLSLSSHPPSPRRQTIGTLVGATTGALLNKHRRDLEARKKALKAAKSKTAAPFVFKGTATKRFLSKPGKSIKDMTPKIGRIGVMPT